MGLFGAAAGKDGRTHDEIKADQSRAKLDDANESTRRTVTVEEIRKLRTV